MFLEPQTPDSNFPSNVSAAVIANTDLRSSASRVSSFKFEVKTSNNGPVFPRHSTGLKRCRIATGVLHFEFKNPTSVSLDLSTPRINNFLNPLNWYPQNYVCFIKILVKGTSTSLFLVRSYGPNQSRHYGDSAVTAERVSSGNNAFVACAEIRCPGDVFYPTTDDLLPEWTQVQITHLTGDCDFDKQHLRRQQDLDGNNATCPPRSKGHSPGSETLLCVPLPPVGNFRTFYVYTSDYINTPIVGKNRCLSGDNSLVQAGTQVQANEVGPSVEFSCK